ncbi:MAG: tRNA 2-selenouridine(34) synthase MnmH [Planctomycetota bacterium]|nr:tRNA 2-selenouridine(34) synthase MnmH [Planctomycetota bacterium]
MPSRPQESRPIDFRPTGEPVPSVCLSAVDDAASIIDVRSPGEFEIDHIPESNNVPLLDDEERSTAGSIYRSEGQETAQQWALLRLSSRLENFFCALKQQVGARTHPVICCARGGARSAHVVQFLIGRGIEARQLEGGYRSFRQGVRENLSTCTLANLFVLDGYTGVGKTRLLQRIDASHPGRVLDLEQYAGHRSSVLGDIGLNPTSQKCFESHLVAALVGLDPESPWYLIEGESRKVGDRQIPQALWDRMSQAPRIELMAGLERRARMLVEDYTTDAGWQPVIDRIETLRGYDKLGIGGVERVQELLRGGQAIEAATYLLQHHYDPRYRHGGQQKQFLFAIENLETAAAAQELVNRLDQMVAS